MAMIAQRYYVKGRSKLAIAEELGLSRHKVARSLLKARESGMVRISIDFPGDLTAALCRQIAGAYRLRRALVVDTPDSDEAVPGPLGRAGPQFVAEVVRRNDTLGIALDRTLGPLTAQLSDLAVCAVVHLTGGSSSADVVAQLQRPPGGPVPRVVVATGPSQREAISAALSSGLIDSLLTDVSTAHYLLAATTSGRGY